MRRALSSGVLVAALLTVPTAEPLAQDLFAYPNQGQSQEQQDKRFRERKADGRKTWKLSPMDMEARRRWYDYSRARDAMFAATDIPEAPWHIVPSDDQRRARLNCIAHFLSCIPYEEIPRKGVRLPPLQAKGGYVEPDYRAKYIPQVY